MQSFRSLALRGCLAAPALTCFNPDAVVGLDCTYDSECGPGYACSSAGECVDDADGDYSEDDGDGDDEDSSDAANPPDGSSSCSPDDQACAGFNSLDYCDEATGQLVTLDCSVLCATDGAGSTGCDIDTSDGYDKCMCAYYYGDPEYDWGCTIGEVVLTVTDYDGEVCSPPCDSSGGCAPAPEGSSALEQCVLSTQDGEYCALVCTSHSQCPGAATCEYPNGRGSAGLCLYL